MVNTAQQGARFERACIAYLEKRGYDCIRSAASKGAVDIVAVGPGEPVNPNSLLREDTDSGPLLFIQCKLSNPVIPPAERVAVLGLALRAGALPIVSWWARPEGERKMRPNFRILTGPGPKEWVPWEPGKELS